MFKTLMKSLMRGGDAAAWLSRAQALQKAGEPRDAIAAYRSALARGADPAPVQLQLGVLHAGLSEHAPAIAALEKAIALVPQDADAICMLGTVLSDQRRVEAAIGQFERALALRPDFPEAHFNLGLARFERADFAGASRSFTRCMELNRGAPWCAAQRAAPASQPSPPFSPKDMAVNQVKLRHDCEQLEYLLELGRLPASYADVLRDYQALLGEVGSIDVETVVPFD